MSNKHKKRKMFLKKEISVVISLIITTAGTIINLAIGKYFQTNNWYIVLLITATVTLIMLITLSFFISKINRDTISEIIDSDGELNTYISELKETMTTINQTTCDFICTQGKENHESIQKLQSYCKRNIETYFLEQYKEMTLFKIDEIVYLEKNVNNGEIWIITDELKTEIENQRIFSTIGNNLCDGTRYHYFYNSHPDIATDVERRLKKAFVEQYQIDNINERIIFTQLDKRYDAFVAIIKDMIILNPQSDNRRAFICIYENDDFNTAIYRELINLEISKLQGMLSRM